MQDIKEEFNKGIDILRKTNETLEIKLSILNKKLS
jgi:hypothetical protein